MNTGIVDFTAVERTLRGELEHAGAALCSAVRSRASPERLRRCASLTPAASSRPATRWVCADTWSDRLAVLAGAPPEPRTVPFRGGFLRVRRDRSHLVR